MRYRLLLSLLFFFNLCLGICADKATNSCNEILTAWNRFSISEPVDIDIQGVPYEGYWPDGKICMMKSDEKYICYWGEGSSFRTSSTSPLLENHKINWDNLVYGKNKGGVEGFYDGGAWIIGIHSLGNDKLVGFFHAESHWDEYPYEGAYKSIGVTYSYDNGITWSEGKRIISTDYSKPDSPGWCGLGDGCVVWNSELKSFICYYSASSGGDYRICMAASPDLEGKPGTWKKWDGTNFTNEGCNPYSQLGGKDVYIEGLYQVSGSNPSVMWNTFLNRWIMTYASWSGQIYLSSSLDGINWEEPILAFSENGKQTYPNLISTEGDCVGGQSLRLYYGHNQGDDGRRKLAYREIIFEEEISSAIYYYINEDGTSVSVTYGPDGEGTYSGNVTVPASVSIGGKTYFVTGIGENAFKGCSSLTSVTLPEGLKTIGIRGFDVCTSLESINFPSTLTSIGDYAFALCAALKGEIALPAGVTSLPIGAFAYCESITSLTLPSTFKTIGIETFLNCKSLETVNLPNGLTGIGESAFSVCGKLVSITLPQSLTDLGGNVFSGCSSLKSIAIPSGVKVIGRDAFASCTSLETVSLSEGLTEIGVNAFLDCKSLTSVTVPASVTKVGDQAFKMCEALLKVALPDALATIGNYVFAACLNLKEVNIPSSLKQLPEGMFHDCCALEEVVIPASSTAIGINTFHNCQSLKNVALPAGLTKIGSCAFEWSGLTSVDIPEAVTQIDEKAFSGCSALADVTVSWKEPISINENVFAESMKETLHVPSGTQSAYQQATGWMDFENIVSDDTEPEPEPETENAFAINDTKVMAGSVFTMPVELKNSCEVAAFQCDIYLPEGITLQKNNKGKYEISLDENRKDDHSITIAEQPDGAIRIVVASLSSSTFSGTEGTLFNMELLVAEDVSGEKSVAIKNIHISEADGKRHELADADATVSIQTYTPADANNDGMIAIDDVVLTINAVLGNASENFVFDAADMNGDGQILIDDVVKVINAVLGVNTSAASNARRADINESFILNHTESGLGMSISNAAGYAALQYDLQLPEGAEVTGVRFTGKSNHKVTFREMDGNEVRVTVVSLTNEAFSGNELLDVMIDSAQDAEISIENAIVATCNGAVSKVQNASAKIGGNATAIDQLLDGMARADVYDLNGKLVKKNAATVAGLQKGIYIINGKKIRVK